MAGTLVIDTLSASSGVLATQNGMTGIAKAWVNYNGVAGTITGSFNVGSVTKNGTGDYTVNYTTAMPSSSYTAIFSAGQTNDSGNFLATQSRKAAFSTTSCRFVIWNSGNVYADASQATAAIFA